jgi:hypothetical protein
MAGEAVSALALDGRSRHPLLAIVLALSLVGCGQSQPGSKGDPGPPGLGLPVRLIKAECDPRSCTVECAEDELLLSAYCGPKRNPAVRPTARSATCRNQVAANSPVVAACMKMPPG